MDSSLKSHGAMMAGTYLLPGVLLQYWGEVRQVSPPISGLLDRYRKAEDKFLQKEKPGRQGARLSLMVGESARCGAPSNELESGYNNLSHSPSWRVGCNHAEDFRQGTEKGDRKRDNLNFQPACARRHILDPTPEFGV
jgi:hypothetical protein